LDVFIKLAEKYKRKTLVGLEAPKDRCLSIVKKIKPEDAVPEKNREILMKRNQTILTKHCGVQRKDIVMLDSIYKLMMSKLKHYDYQSRNVIMTIKSIDSLAKTGIYFRLLVQRI
jgi:hypothetical protein